MLNREAVSYLRHRRATYFFDDRGPALPAGLSARWRRSPDDPHGWHANMVGFIDGPVAALPSLLDVVVRWFNEGQADSWVDADEFGVLFRHQDLLPGRGFRLSDDWDAMICRRLNGTQANPAVAVTFADAEDEVAVAAWIAEQVDREQSVPGDDPRLLRRKERFWTEYREHGTRFAVATLDGRPAGSARLTNEPLPLVVGVATLHSARGNGVASALTAFLTHEALRLRGACALYVERDSQAARIYARAGFRPLFRSRAWVRSYVGEPEQVSDTRN